jgi:hypothetical protein
MLTKEQIEEVIDLLQRVAVEQRAAAASNNVPVAAEWTRGFAQGCVTSAEILRDKLAAWSDYNEATRAAR